MKTYNINLSITISANSDSEAIDMANAIAKETSYLRNVMPLTMPTEVNTMDNGNFRRLDLNALTDMDKAGRMFVQKTIDEVVDFYENNKKEQQAS